MPPGDDLEVEGSERDPALEAIKASETVDPANSETAGGGTDGGMSSSVDGGAVSTAGHSETSSSSSEAAPAQPLGFDPEGASVGTIPSPLPAVVEGHTLDAIAGVVASGVQEVAAGVAHVGSFIAEVAHAAESGAAPTIIVPGVLPSGDPEHDSIAGGT